MLKERVPLYDRLPEIYRIKDSEGRPKDQLKNYLSLVEAAYGTIHENIEALYDDLFIETCDDWVIPYIGDLLGTSHLSGDPWTLRADVADTIALRRRKGTLASIERLTYDLTRWGVHCVELRENMVWNQHLNHQRPDAGGDPPLSQSSVTRFTPPRGGTVPVRDPAMLSLLNSPFDPFGHVADLKPPIFGAIRHNLPNLAIFLWRLEDYRVKATKPVWRGRRTIGGVRIVRFDVHPLGRPVQLFNTYQFDPEREPPVLTEIDRTPGPIPRPRLTEGHEAGRPESYVAVETYDPDNFELDKLEFKDVGLQLHLPLPEFKDAEWPEAVPARWKIRGANLCAWEKGVLPAIKSGEIIIDPEIGRILIGVNSIKKANALKEEMLVTYTYGAVGQVGAHPGPRPSLFQHDGSVNIKTVDFHKNASGLKEALDNIHQATGPTVIEIRDSMVHDLNPATILGRINEGGGVNLRLRHPLTIRAADGERPIIRLKSPLRLRAFDPGRAENVTLRLEGLYLTRGEGYPGNAPLIERAALEELELVECTLDPGGHKVLDGTAEGSRAPIRKAIELEEGFGFDTQNEILAFDPTPEILLQRTISGPVCIDRGYSLALADSILDAGVGVGDDPGDQLVVTSASDPLNGWGPPTDVRGLTAFGRMRVESIHGRGGIFVHRLEVLNHQIGCLRYSYFSGDGDVLPQNLGSVDGTEARLRFVSEVYENSAYGQLAHTTDRRIKEDGPRRTEISTPINERWEEPSYKVVFEGNKAYKLGDQMGAYGFLLEAHKWRNIQIRFREFMPVGVRPLLLPVT